MADAGRSETRSSRATTGGQDRGAGAGCDPSSELPVRLSQRQRRAAPEHAVPVQAHKGSAVKLSDVPRRCDSRLGDLWCEGKHGHSGQHGAGDDVRWWQSEADHAAEELAKRVSTEAHGGLVGTLLGDRVRVVTGHGYLIGVLLGFDVDPSGAPVTLRLQPWRCSRSYAQLAGSVSRERELLVPWAAVLAIGSEPDSDGS